MKVLKQYIVQRPIRGYQVFFVKASSKKKALKLVDENDISIDPIDFEITHHGKANKVIEDTKR